MTTTPINKTVSLDAMYSILCEFAAAPQCLEVCKGWREIIQQHFCSLSESHVKNSTSTSMQRFMTRALSMPLTFRRVLEAVPGQGLVAFFKDTSLLVFNSLNRSIKPNGIGQIIFLSTPNIEKLIQSNKDANLVSFYDSLRSQIGGPEITKASDVRDWMRDNPAPLAEVRRLLKIDSPDLTEIPEEINFLTGLEYLNLSGTQISALPDGLNLPNLIYLDLSHTPISALPDGLNLSNLERLVLSHTPISALPDGLNLPALEFLYMDHMPISSLPGGLNLPALFYLDLSHTPISALPDGLDLPALQSLFLNNTPIAAWPDRSNLPRLRYRIITNTPLEANLMGRGVEKAEEEKKQA